MAGRHLFHILYLAKRWKGCVPRKEELSKEIKRIITIPSYKLFRGCKDPFSNNKQDPSLPHLPSLNSPFAKFPFLDDDDRGKERNCTFWKRVEDVEDYEEGREMIL